MQVRGVAGRIRIVARGAAEAGVQQADVHGTLDRRLEFGEQAFRRVMVGEADAVDDDGLIAVPDRDRASAAAEDRDRVRVGKFLGDLGHRVVIAADDEHLDAGLVQGVDLVGEEAGGLHGGLLAVVQVAGEQQGVDLFVEAEADDGNKGPPGGVADEIGERRVAQGQGTQGRGEGQVGGMHETKTHAGLD